MGILKRAEYNQTSRTFLRAALVVQRLRIHLPVFRGHRFNPWSRKIPHPGQQLSPWAATAEVRVHLQLVFHNERSHCNEKLPRHNEGVPPPTFATRARLQAAMRTLHSHLMLSHFSKVAFYSCFMNATSLISCRRFIIVACDFLLLLNMVTWSFFHFLISLFWFGLVSQIPSTYELCFLVIRLYLKVRH